MGEWFSRVCPSPTKYGRMSLLVRMGTHIDSRLYAVETSGRQTPPHATPRCCAAV